MLRFILFADEVFIVFEPIKLLPDDMKPEDSVLSLQNPAIGPYSLAVFQVKLYVYLLFLKHFACIVHRILLVLTPVTTLDIGYGLSSTHKPRERLAQANSCLKRVKLALTKCPSSGRLFLDLDIQVLIPYPDL
jgi:hypothetical protein